MRLSESCANITGFGVLRGGVWLLWHAVRVFMLGLLVLLEPVVRCLFGIAMYLGILAAVIFEFSAVGPRFPFLAMLAASLACGFVLFLYYGLVALLVRQG